MNSRVKEIVSAVGACGLLLGALLACAGGDVIVGTSSPAYQVNNHWRTNIWCSHSLYYCYRRAEKVCGSYEIVSGDVKPTNFREWTMTIECK